MQERGTMSLQINMFKFIPEGIYADIKELIKTLNKQMQLSLLNSIPLKPHKNKT